MLLAVINLIIKLNIHLANPHLNILQLIHQTSILLFHANHLTIEHIPIGSLILYELLDLDVFVVDDLLAAQDFFLDGGELVHLFVSDLLDLALVDVGQLLFEVVYLDGAVLLGLDEFVFVVLDVAFEVGNSVLVVRLLLVELGNQVLGLVMSVIDVLLQPIVFELHLLQIMEMRSFDRLDLLQEVILKFRFQ